MRFSEYEMTRALEGAAKSVVAAPHGLRRKRRDAEEAWQELEPMQRFRVLDGLGEEILPVLGDLPEVDVAPGARPTFTERQVRAAVEARVGDGGGKIRRETLIRTRVALVQTALAALPRREDPGTLEVPDHLPDDLL